MKWLAWLVHRCVTVKDPSLNNRFRFRAVRAELDRRGAAAVIPPKANRKASLDYAKFIYQWRHLIEKYFAKRNKFRAIATPYDNIDTSFRAAAVIAVQ